MTNPNKALGAEIKRARKNKQYSQAQLTKILGWVDLNDPTARNSRLSNYETGLRTPDIEALAAISLATDWPLERFTQLILREQAEKLGLPIGKKIEVAEQVAGGVSGTKNIVDTADSAAIPSLKAPINKGSKHFYVSREWLKVRDLKYGNLRRMTYDFDNQEPSVKKGSTVIVDTGSTTLKSGDLYLFDIHGDYQIKHVVLLATGSIELATSSEKYRNEVVGKEDIKGLSVIGKVVATFSDY